MNCYDEPRIQHLELKKKKNRQKAKIFKKF